MSIDSRTRFILWFALGAMVALILAYLPDALSALWAVLFYARVRLAAQSPVKGSSAGLCSHMPGLR